MRNPEHILSLGMRCFAMRRFNCFSTFFLFTQNSDSHDEAILAPIAFEVSSNASKFAAFSAIRSLVLEHETKLNVHNKLEGKLKSLEQHSRSDNDGSEFKGIDLFTKVDCKINVPFVSLHTAGRLSLKFTQLSLQIVSAGIQTLFDIIAETKHQHPAICSRALSSLFDIFQGKLTAQSAKALSY